MTDYAPLYKRVLAYLLDVLIVFLLLTPLWIWFIRGLLGPQSGGYLLGYSMFLPLIWTGARCFYLVLFWFHRGATIGMNTTKIKVTSIEGEELQLRKAILRYIGFFVSTLPYGAGFLVALFTKRKQGLQDLIAGTVVIDSSERI